MFTNFCITFGTWLDIEEEGSLKNSPKSVLSLEASATSIIEFEESRILSGSTSTSGSGNGGSSGGSGSGRPGSRESSSSLNG